jgi:hypothetical protein
MARHIAHSARHRGCLRCRLLHPRHRRGVERRHAKPDDHDDRKHSLEETWHVHSADPEKAVCGPVPFRGPQSDEIFNQMSRERLLRSLICQQSEQHPNAAITKPAITKPGKLNAFLIDPKAWRTICSGTAMAGSMNKKQSYDYKTFRPGCINDDLRRDVGTSLCGSYNIGHAIFAR